MLITILITNFHTPICFDATCSGMQHLSALISEIDLGKMSNVIGEGLEIRNDVYESVANLVNNKIKSIKDINIKTKFEQIDFNRKLLKKPVMTVPYNVSLNSMTDQLIGEGFFEKRFSDLGGRKTYYYIVNNSILKDKNSHLSLTSKEMGTLSALLYNSIYEKYPPLK